MRDLGIIKAATGVNFESTPIFCSGIEVCERALEQGARNVSFHQLSRETLGRLENIPDSVVSTARAFDVLHSDLRTRHLGLEVSSVGWDYLNIAFIVQTIKELQTAIPPFVETLPSGALPVLFRCKNAQDFYFDSSMNRDVIRKAIAKKYSEVFSIEISPPDIFREKGNSFELKIPTGSFRVLSHLPTVFYSIPFHQSRLSSDTDKGLLDLESPYFDVPMSPNRILLQSCERNFVPAPLLEYWRALKSLLSDLYSSLDISEEARAGGMFDRHKGWAFSQYESYLSLRSSSALAQVERVEVSCHDAGLSGPLLTWANERGIAVEMWPHSEVINTPTPVLNKGCKHSYFPRATAPLELGIGKSQWVGARVRQTNSPRGKKRMLILMNQMDSPACVPRCRPFELKKGIEFLLKRLSAEGWQIKLRHKPSHSCRILFEMCNMEHANGPLGDWFEWPEVCLSVATPTTAMIGFWENGARCYHLQEILLGLGEKFVLPHEGITVYQGAEYAGLFLRLANDLAES